MACKQAQLLRGSSACGELTVNLYGPHFASLMFLTRAFCAKSLLGRSTTKHHKASLTPLLMLFAQRAG